MLVTSLDTDQPPHLQHESSNGIPQDTFWYKYITITINTTTLLLSGQIQ